MSAIHTGNRRERSWHASPCDYAATEQLMERHGFPELAREWWDKAVRARRREPKEVRTVGACWPARCSSLPAC